VELLTKVAPQEKKQQAGYSRGSYTFSREDSVSRSMYARADEKEETLYGTMNVNRIFMNKWRERLPCSNTSYWLITVRMGPTIAATLQARTTVSFMNQ
jgi:hypothetical protein